MHWLLRRKRWFALSRPGAPAPWRGKSGVAHWVPWPAGGEARGDLSRRAGDDPLSEPLTRHAHPEGGVRHHRLTIRLVERRRRPRRGVAGCQWDEPAGAERRVASRATRAIGAAQRPYYPKAPDVVTQDRRHPYRDADPGPHNGSALLLSPPPGLFNHLDSEYGRCQANDSPDRIPAARFPPQQRLACIMIALQLTLPRSIHLARHRFHRHTQLAGVQQTAPLCLSESFFALGFQVCRGTSTLIIGRLQLSPPRPRATESFAPLPTCFLLSHLAFSCSLLLRRGGAWCHRRPVRLPRHLPRPMLQHKEGSVPCTG